MYQFNPYNPYMPQAQPPQQILKVNGENGAKAVRLAPNSGTLALDETASIVWLIMSDGAGYTTQTPYDIFPHQQEKQVDIKSIEERLSRLEEIINGKSNITSNETA